MDPDIRITRCTSAHHTADETQDIPAVFGRGFSEGGFRKGMVRPRSRGSYALRQLKSPLSNISSLGLAGLKSTGTFVIQGVTQGQMTDVHLGLVP